MDNRPWITYFSQTGSEICDLAEKLGRWPDRIITNKRPDHLRTIDSRIPKDRLMVTENRPQLHEYAWLMQDYKEPLITLHGWLRVMPKNICSRFEIYNGHPGLISRYPDLKGKDPQVKAWEANYNTLGSVIHKVTPGVDEGEILAEKSFTTENILPLDKIFARLKETSLELWYEFLKEKL